MRFKVGDIISNGNGYYFRINETYNNHYMIECVLVKMSAITKQGATKVGDNYEVFHDMIDRHHNIYEIELCGYTKLWRSLNA